MQTVEYDYDENSKTYVRYARGKVQTDYITGENIQTKNIIITMCDNYTLAVIRIKQGDENARTEFIKGNLRLVLSVIQMIYFK